MIPMRVSVMGEAEAQAAAEVVLSGWLSQGPQVAAFEEEFAAAVGAPHACAVSSCTAALHLAFVALGIGTGDEVVTASHAHIASANVIRQCGAVPVFADIDPMTFTIAPEAVAAAITPRTKAILCVHQMGMPCDLERIRAIADAHGIPVIEDAAGAIGSEIRTAAGWERIGRPHGAIACFSLHSSKPLSAGDGGVLTTANAEWNARFRLLRQHGMRLSHLPCAGHRRPIGEEYPVAGFNYRLTDLQAAIGRQQLHRLPDIVARRRALAARYDSMLSLLSEVVAPREPPWAHANWQSYCVRLPNSADRAQVMQRLLDREIATEPGTMCIHREASYADLALRAPLPQSEAAQRSCLLLPLFPEMEDAMQQEVVAALREALR